MRALALLLALPLSAQAGAPAADTAYFKGDPKAIAAACAGRAMAIEGKDSRLLAEYGRAFLASGDRPRAEEAFRKAVARDRGDGETYRLIGLAWLANGFKAEAMKALDELQRVAPHSDRILKLAAMDLLQAGMVPEAETLMKSARVAAPLDTDNIKDFAQAAIRTGHEEAANRWAELAWEVDPYGLQHDWHDCLDFALAAQKAGMTDIAAKWFARTVAARPKEERMWNAIALAFADAATHPAAPARTAAP